MNKFAKDNSSLAFEAKISLVLTGRVNIPLKYQPTEYLEFQKSVARGFPNWNIAPKKPVSICIPAQSWSFVCFLVSSPEPCSAVTSGTQGAIAL